MLSFLERLDVAETLSDQGDHAAALAQLNEMKRGLQPAQSSHLHLVRASIIARSGRLQEALTEHQLASAAQTQMAVSRAVLAQKLNQSTNSEAVRDYAISMKYAANSGVLGPRGRRGVGYRPVITTLPEGTNMTATAVISADRRYVRITAIPLFSVIDEVSTFNFSIGTDDGGNNAVP